MKIGIVAPSPVPFTPGGAERLWAGLSNAIRELTPHDVEIIKLPCREHSLRDLVAAYADFARLDVSHFDAVITGKYPAWAVRHPRHLIYLLHRLRGLYDDYRVPFDASIDTGGTELDDFRDYLRRGPEGHEILEVASRFEALVAAVGSDHPALRFPGPLARQLVHHLDGVAMDPARIHRYTAISATVAARDGYFPAGVPVLPLWPPSALSDFRTDAYEYLFTVSRIDIPKRIDLLIRAMRHVDNDMRLVIAGGGPDLDRCRALAAADPRVELIGPVNDAALLDHYARARAVAFVPEDEDLGLIAYEAMSSGKPVITCTDSGGVLELVANEVNGLIVEPTPEALGAALQRLADDEPEARRLGQAGRVRASGISWGRVLRGLLAEPVAPRQPPVRSLPHQSKGRVVVLATFPIHPRRGGGQIRSWHLCRALLPRHDVIVVSLDSAGTPARRVEIEPGFTEVVVPKSVEHERQEQELAASAGIAVTDIAANLLIQKTPAYLEEVRTATAGAAAVVLAHPYLLPVVDELDLKLPIIYDAQDVEVRLKGEVLRGTSVADHLVSAVREVEDAVLRRASIVVPCTEADAVGLTEEYGVDSGKILVIGNGADISRVRYCDPAERKRSRMRWLRTLGSEVVTETRHSSVLFIGSAHPPNIEAARHLIAQWADVPDVLLVLAGGMCAPLGQWGLPPGVLLLGEITEASKQRLLDCVDLGLNAVTRGSGTNLKLVEYMAAGLPILSTPVGVRGMGEDVVALLEVRELDQFASSIPGLLERPEWDVRVREARRIAEQRYDWRSLGALFEEAADRSISTPVA